MYNDGWCFNDQWFTLVDLHPFPHRRLASPLFGYHCKLVLRFSGAPFGFESKDVGSSLFKIDLSANHIRATSPLIVSVQNHPREFDSPRNQHNSQ